MGKRNKRGRKTTNQGNQQQQRATHAVRKDVQISRTGSGKSVKLSSKLHLFRALQLLPIEILKDSWEVLMKWSNKAGLLIRVHTKKKRSKRR